MMSIGSDGGCCRSDLVTATPHGGRSLLEGRTWAAAVVAVAATQLLGAAYLLCTATLRLWRRQFRPETTPAALWLMLMTCSAAQLLTVVLIAVPAGFNAAPPALSRSALAPFDLVLPSFTGTVFFISYCC